VGHNSCLPNPIGEGEGDGNVLTSGARSLPRDNTPVRIRLSGKESVGGNGRVRTSPLYAAAKHRLDADTDHPFHPRAAYPCRPMDRWEPLLTTVDDVDDNASRQSSDVDLALDRDSNAFFAHFDRVLLHQQKSKVDDGTSSICSNTTSDLDDDADSVRSGSIASSKGPMSRAPQNKSSNSLSASLSLAHPPRPSPTGSHSSSLPRPLSSSSLVATDYASSAPLDISAPPMKSPLSLSSLDAERLLSSSPSPSTASDGSSATQLTSSRNNSEQDVLAASVVGAPPPPHRTSLHAPPPPPPPSSKLLTSSSTFSSFFSHISRSKSANPVAENSSQQQQTHPSKLDSRLRIGGEDSV
jgi:hypothetical protein